MTRSLRTSLRAVALVGVTALTAGTLGLIASPAMADPGDGGTGSITVHKHEQVTGDLGPNDGTELDLSGMSVNPLVAGFTACAIDGIDLKKAADWPRLKKLVLTAGATAAAPPLVTENGAPVGLSCGAEQTTAAADGVTAFKNLAADRAYVVYESASPKGALQLASPTIVTVPYPGKAPSTWNYNPHIYPKNTIAGSGATKTLRDSFGNLTYTITVPVKPLPPKETYTEFIIEDQLSANLVYTKLATVKLTNAAGGSVTLTAADYKLTGTLNATKTKLILELTASGLAKLDANIGGKLTMSFGAKPINKADVANYALIRVNGSNSVNQRAVRSGGESEIGTPGNGWYYGGQHYDVFVKSKSTGARTQVEGAGFQTYMMPNRKATSCPATEAEILSLPDWEDDLLGPDPEDIMSDATGIAWMTGDPETGLHEGAYCGFLKIMPQGFKGSPGPYYFNVVGLNGKLEIELERTDITTGDLPALPITGGAGNLVLVGAGGTLLLAAGALVVARRRGAIFGSRS